MNELTQEEILAMAISRKGSENKLKEAIKLRVITAAITVVTAYGVAYASTAGKLHAQKRNV